MIYEDVCILEGNSPDQLNERIRKLMAKGYYPIGDVKVAFGQLIIMMAADKIDTPDVAEWPDPTSKTAQAIREIENND
jgi:hypothetical protein